MRIGSFDLQSARDEMSRRHLEAIVSCSPENSYYVSGTYMVSHYAFRHDRPVICLIPLDSDPVLIIHSWEYAQAKDETWIKDARTYKMFRSWVGNTPMDVLASTLCEKGLQKSRIGIDGHHLTMYERDKLRGEMKSAELVECGDLFQQMRLVKSGEELHILHKAASATEKSILTGMKEVRQGDTERSLAESIAVSLVRLGADLTFSPCFLIVGAGERSVINIAAPTQRRIKEGEIVRIDLGGSFSGYRSDLARIAAVGKPDQRLVSTYDKFTEIAKDVIAAIRPGVSASEVFKLAREAYDARELPFGLYEMVGHGIGLENHEEPILSSTNKTVLRENMVLNVELALQFGEEMMAYEDTIVVTNKGAKLLSGLQKELPLIP